MDKFVFEEATKKECRLRLAIDGPSGSGKTFTSLVLATALAEKRGGKIAVIDSERGSASKYADIFKFSRLNIDAPFSPERYVNAILTAERAGFAVLVIDSLSHAWEGEGGLLEQVDNIARRSKSGNTFNAWKDGSPMQQKLINSILGVKMDVLVTMRTKTEYIIEEDGRGKKVPRKIGMAPVQRQGLEYEFDVVFDMDHDNNAVVSKSRCHELSGKVFPRPGRLVADTLWNWLQGEKEEHIEDSTEAVCAPSVITSSLPAPASRGLVDKDSLTLLVGSLKDAGLVTRETAIARVSELAGRPVSSFSHLTQPEFKSVYDALQKERAEALLQT